MSSDFSLRVAQPGDVPAIVGLITELAEFEHLTHLLEVTPGKLAPHLFGERPMVECVVGEVNGDVVAFALFFNNFSTFDKVRIHRHRMMFGAHYKYELLYVGTQFLVDAAPPDDENPGLNESRQWTLSLEAGVFF